MEEQDIEYDSVADLCVAVSDDEDGDFFVADDGHATKQGISATQGALAAYAVTTVHVGSAVNIIQARAPMGVSEAPS